MNHSLLLLALTSASFFVATSLATIGAYLYFSPSIKFAPVPLAVPPSYSDIGTPGNGYRADDDAKAIKADDESTGLGLLQIKEEEDDDNDGDVLVASPSVTGSELTATGSGSGSVIVGEGEGDVTEDETETETETERGDVDVDVDVDVDDETGSEGDGVDLGASTSAFRR